MKRVRHLFALFLIASLTIVVAGCGNSTKTKDVTVTAITLTSQSASAAAGKTVQVTATATYSNNTSGNLSGATWTSSNTSVATVDANGLVTTKTIGTAIITAAYNGVSSTYTITVTAPVVQSFSFSTTNFSLALGRTQSLTLSGTLTDGTAAGSSAFSGCTWSSSSTSVATVSPSTGASSTVSTAGTGNSTITVTCGSVVQTTTATVTPAVIVSIGVTPANPSINVGDTQQFTATATMSNNATQNVTSTATWSSSNTSFVTMDPSTLGLAHGETAGSSTIQASQGGINGSTLLTVTAADNPVPAIASLSPASITAAGAAFTLTVNGTGFVAASTVQWNGTPKTTTFVSATKVTAAISASDIASSGTISVVVVNPAPGGGTSQAVVFTINPAASAPHIDSVSPSTVLAGGPAFTLAIQGTGFVNGSVVKWNGNARTTTYVDATHLTASILNADIGSTGTANVVVVNPDTQISNTASETISSQTIGLFKQVSVATDGTSANASFVDMGNFAITPNGRFVVFYSNATNLVAGDTNGSEDTFVRDTCYGVTSGCVPSTIRVSVAPDGTQKAQVNESHSGVAITPDGRYIAFTSAAPNLVPNDTNGQVDVFVRDTCVGASAGCTPSTIRASVATDGSQGNGNWSYNPAISADGRYVVFESYAVLVPGATSDAVYMRDTCAGAPTGCSPATTLVSRSDVSRVGHWPEITADGRYVTYSVYDGTYPDQTNRVYLFDSCNGVPSGCSPSTVQVSTQPDGTPNVRNAASNSMSADGRYVAYFYDVSSGGTILVRDTCTGAPSGCTPSTTMADVAYDGSAPSRGAENIPSISPDGRFVALCSAANNLVSGAQRGNWDIYVRDTCLMGTLASCTPHNVRVSVQPDGSLFPADKGFTSVSPHMISQDGHLAVFPYNGQLYLWLTSF